MTEDQCIHAIGDQMDALLELKELSISSNLRCKPTRQIAKERDLMGSDNRNHVATLIAYSKLEACRRMVKLVNDLHAQHKVAAGQWPLKILRLHKKSLLRLEFELLD